MASLFMNERRSHRPHVRLNLDQAFSRVTGASLTDGNAVRLLSDARENYPAWLDALKAAEHRIFFENYMFAEDEVGEQFANVLAERARAGVKVYLIRDWLGSYPVSSRHLWNRLEAAGVQLRCYNPPRLDKPLAWIGRDHRKMIAIDGRVAFIGGLCVSAKWLGKPEQGVDPWRDTAVEIRGLAVADAERAFAEIWRAMGPPLRDDELTDKTDFRAEGEVALRVIATAPNVAGLFRLDQLVAAAAKRTLWLTDAYFVGFTPDVQALRAAAADGVDVRLLVPNSTDIPFVRLLSRAGYKPLLEAGIRVFEWNGSMLHCKTAVADAHWVRIGSSNRNLASFLGNYELDVAIEDHAFGQAMHHAYEADLENSTEIVLGRGKRVLSSPGIHMPRQAKGRGAPVAAVGAVRIAAAVGAAIKNRRQLGGADRTVALGAAAVCLSVSVLAVVAPRVLAYPIAAAALWFSVSLFWGAASSSGKGPRH